MTPESETPLTRDIVAAIRAQGPMSVSRYMDLCLNHPEHGYYRRRRAIGAAGDFVTAPEISQIFGELIGLWCAVVWRQMGEPAPIRIVEFGPGRGTLMRDALRAAQSVPGVLTAASVLLVEQNETLREEQRQTLGEAPCPVGWIDKADAIHDGVSPPLTIIIANEFLDVLPRDQVVFDEGRWVERNIGVSDENDLIFVAGASSESAPSLACEPKNGDIFERSEGYASFLASSILPLNPIAALFIDYGHEQSGFGDTLQAVEGHKPVSPLTRCGQADLTMQVDFEAFARAATDVRLYADGPVTQAGFLGHLGAVERASALMAANPKNAAGIEASLARLVSPGGMGSRFKALGLRTEALATLPGFEPNASPKRRERRM